MREFVFKTSAPTNVLCRWTREDTRRWILIQLLRSTAQGRAAGAVFTIHGPTGDAERFLKEEFGKRYGTFRTLQQRGELVSVEVTNYLLPAYRGADPVELATQLLGPDVLFAPILVHEGFIHVRAFATPPAEARSFGELMRRITAAANPDEFQLLHTGEWDPIVALKPQSPKLTDRQREVLRVGIEFGYYDEPRRCTLDDVAKAMAISKAAVHKHLVSAESRILKAYPL